MSQTLDQGIQLHAWNQGFSWSDQTDKPTHLRSECLEQFDRDGFFILENVFGGDELADVIKELDSFEQRTDTFLQAIDGERAFIAESGAITFSPNLVASSQNLAEFVRHPQLLGIARDIVGPDVNLYWEQAVYKKSEKQRRFPWHQDNGYRFVQPQAYLTCWISLTDATADNGCPQVAPGLHRLGTLAHHYVDPLGWECFDAPPVEPVMAELGAGGIVVFSSLTPHLTGPNTTGSVRKAYIVQYAPVGAVALEGQPPDEPTGRVLQNSPDFQFPV